MSGEGGGDTAGPTRIRPGRRCPICGRPASEEAYPFCSTRCADVDLNRWLKGVYAIPAADSEAEDEPEDEV